MRFNRRNNTGVTNSNRLNVEPPILYITTYEYSLSIYIYIYEMCLARIPIETVSWLLIIVYGGKKVSMETKHW